MDRGIYTWPRDSLQNWEIQTAQPFNALIILIITFASSLLGERTVAAPIGQGQRKIAVITDSLWTAPQHVMKMLHVHSVKE
ncbi:MAG: hypothetical protein WB643_12640 [Candidatus Bathyarchaeia archaeon]